MNKYEYRTEDLGRFFSSKGNYKNYNACIYIRIWNDDSFFFYLEFFKERKKTISRLLLCDEITMIQFFFSFFASTSIRRNLYDATSIGNKIFRRIRIHDIPPSFFSKLVVKRSRSLGRLR